MTNNRTPATNAHIAKIAALPRVDRFCVFSLPLLALIKCWNAATSAICRNVTCKRRTSRADNEVENKSELKRNINRLKGHKKNKAQ